MFTPRLQRGSQENILELRVPSPIMRHELGCLPVATWFVTAVLASTLGLGSLGQVPLCLPAF